MRASCSEKWIIHHSLNPVKAEDFSGATGVTENQNHKTDPGQEGRLTSEAETANIQHIYQTTQPQAATCES